MNPKRTNPKGTLRTPGSKVAQERPSLPGGRVGQGWLSSPGGRVVRQARLSSPGRRRAPACPAAIALALFIAGGGG